MCKDRLGILISSLCLCHCLLTPLLFLLLGSNALLGGEEHEWMHKIILGPVLLLAALTIPRTYWLTRNKHMLTLAILGISAFVVAQLIHGYAELVLTMIGSICLIGAHSISLKLMRGCEHRVKTEI